MQARPTEKTMLSMEDYEEAMRHIEQDALASLSNIIEIVHDAAVDTNYINFFKRIIQYYSNISDILATTQPYALVMQHADALKVITEKLYGLIAEEFQQDRMAEDEVNESIEGINRIQSATLRASMCFFKSEPPTQTPQDMFEFISKTVNNLFNLAFGQPKFNPHLKLSIHDVHQCINRLIAYFVERAEAAWVSSPTQKDALRLMQHRLGMMGKYLQMNGVNPYDLNITKQALTQLQEKIKGLMAAKPNPAALFTPPPEDITLKNGHISKIKRLFFDFDDTIYELLSETISEEIQIRLRVLHDHLKIKMHIITARNAEMDHASYSFYDTITKQILYVEKRPSIFEILTAYQLQDVIPKNNILYCDFYQKIMTPSDKHPHHYSEDAIAKDSKLPDFLNACKTLGEEPDHTAVFDDNKRVWNDIRRHTQNAFSVDNKTPGLTLADRLNKVMLQLMLHGEHLPLADRLSAAKQCIHAETGLFKFGSPYFVALEKFITHHHSQEAHPSPKPSY